MKTKLLRMIRRQYHLKKEVSYFGEKSYYAVNRFTPQMEIAPTFNDLMEDVMLSMCSSSRVSTIQKKHRENKTKRDIAKRTKRLGLTENQILWLKKE